MERRGAGGGGGGGGERETEEFRGESEKEGSIICRRRGYLAVCLFESARVGGAT